MADFWYDEAKRAIAAGEIDLDANDLRVALLMTNTTANTEKNKTNLGAFTTLDECDGVAYARQALASKTVTVDNGNNRADIDAADVTFPTVSASTRAVKAVLVYKHVGADAVNVPLLYMDSLTGLPFTPNGANVSLIWAAAGYGRIS